MSDMTPGEDAGQMPVPVQAGASRVQIDFIRTWDRTAGGWVSIIAIVLALVSLKRVAPASRRLLGQDSLVSRPEPAEGTAAETAALPES